MNERELFETWAKGKYDLTQMPGTDVYENPITGGLWLGWMARAIVEPHCISCQCSRLNQPVPAPGMPLSRSWHGVANKKPDIE